MCEMGVHVPWKIPNFFSTDPFVHDVEKELRNLFDLLLCQPLWFALIS